MGAFGELTSGDGVSSNATGTDSADSHGGLVLSNAGESLGASGWSAPGGDVGVLVLHGFTSTPLSVLPLARAFNEAGFTVEVPLLPGHGTRVEELAQCTWQDWSTAVDEACADLVARCNRVAVAGQSMGATLALWLAARHREICGVVAVNPFVEPAADSFLDILRQSLAAGVTTSPSVGSDICAPGIKEVAYPTVPVAALLSLLEGISDLSSQLHSIVSPVLLFSSRKDHVVPSSSGDYLEKAVSGSIERVWLDNSYHVATLDNDSEMLTLGAVSFVRRTAASAGRG